MNAQGVSDLTLDQLQTIIREELQRFRQELPAEAKAEGHLQSDLSDFPVDDLGPWPEGLSLRREDMYGDEGR